MTCTLEHVPNESSHSVTLTLSGPLDSDLISDGPGSDVFERSNALETTCCIAGGGPAGMVLGFLLARAGVDVVVLEKHGDFLRDFRGDTIHPSTLEILHELGLLDEFLKRPHQEARQISGVVGDEEIPVADFTHLPTHCKFIAFMPQWDFLDFIAEHARRYPTFRLRMQRRGHRPARRGRAGRRACRRRPPMARWRSGPS